MSTATPTPAKFYIGWDVGGWNCDRNPNSRDAIVILDSRLSIVGKAWRGNLREPINDCASTKKFIGKLFSLSNVNLEPNDTHIILAIDTPLGLPGELVGLAAGLKYTEPVESSGTNPYLFRETERYLFQQGLKPLSAIKDMIGSQATKGMHVLAKFAPKMERCGVWGDGESLVAIESYPAACKKSRLIENLHQQVGNHAIHNQDEKDALTCALVAYIFEKCVEDLISPPNSVPAREGWIWVPKDIFQGLQL
jgi:predicted nuclease with RNAse H fold